MKITKKSEKEILEVYNAYWDGYMKGDVKSMAPLLDDDYTQIGTAEEEVFFNKKGAVKFLRDTIDQVAGKVDWRNRVIKLESNPTNILVTELGDLYVLIEGEWAFHSKFRASTIMQKKRSIWKITYQHSSFPDIRAQEGENISIEKISLENLQLRDAVKRRTVELEQGKKELEIEAALERVRAQAMSMRKPDELAGVSEIIFNELKALGFADIRNTEIIINKDTKNSITSYYYSDYGVTGTIEVDYTTHPTVKNWMEDLKKTRDSFVAVRIDEKEMKAWRKYRESLGYLPDPKLNKVKQVEYYSYSIGLGALSVSSFKPITDEQLKTLERLKNVFGLAYRRYADVAKAEEQGREAQIELGLERVRARAMAMQNSEELAGLVDTVFKELTKLDISLTRCIIVIMDESTLSAKWWMANSEADNAPSSFYVEYNQLPYFKEFFKAWKTRNAKWIYDLKGKDKKALDDYLFKSTELSKLPARVQSGMRASKGVILSASFNNFGCLHVSSLEPLDEDSIGTLNRFAKVFDLTYTRFNDLKLAEAQGREARIELALERVRARTMAMQNSSELPEAANLLFQQVQSLGMPAWSAGYCLWDDDKQGITLWMSSEGVMQPSFHAPLTKDPSFIHMREAYEKGESFHVEEVGRKALAAHYKYMRALPVVGDVLDSIIEAGHPLPTFQIFHCTYFSQGFLLFITYEPVPEAHDIFKRFAKVFEQTYTRFLDLQKAEAQARELQIQLALERVRARTMAMHHSSELSEAAALLFDQLKQLGIEMWSFALAICQQDNVMVEKYVGNPGIGQLLDPIYIPYTSNAGEQIMYNTWKNEIELFAFVQDGEELRKTYEELMTVPSFKDMMREFIESGQRFPVWQKNYVVTYKFGYLLIITSKPFEETQIFVRFAKVFEQTYTRFLDLQKAEAQARESQIQLSLERVRVRAMAMQTSNELSELVDTVFKELTRLDFALTWCIINIIDEGSLTNMVWAANPEMNNAPESYHMKFEDYPYHHEMLNAYRERKEISVYVLEGQEKKTYDEYLFNETEFRRTPQSAQAASRANEKYVCTFTFCNFGGLQTVGTEPLSDKSLDILNRFGKVFDLTYTRFNDLKQAEAQMREAQIEASLERVRSKTMAMHNSQDVGTTVATMFDELVKLGVETNRCGILIFSDTSKTEVWTAKSSEKGIATLIVGHLDVTIHQMLVSVRQAWKSSENFFSYELHGEDIRNYYEAINNHPDYPTQFDLTTLPAREFHSDFFFPEGAIFSFTAEPVPSESTIIFKRFAGVFGQTYRRFLDLQKAEAQAREATIEASLERVRGRAMAMHNSSDLTSTAGVVFTELRKLGINPIRSGVGLLDKATGMAKLYAATATSEDMNLSLAGTVDMSSHPFLIQQMEAWLKNENFSAVLSGPDLKSYYEAVYGQISVPLSTSRDFQQEEYSYYFPFSAGLFFVWTEKPYSDNEKAILIRFKSIVDLTFRRYLDLQRAEAQARQAQIEAAMEKVRARSSAMQKPEELVEVAEVLRKEMGLLGVEELETSSIYIPDEATGTTECWYAIKDVRDEDKKLLSDHMTIRLNETWVGRQMLDFYRADQEQVSIVMQGENRKEWINYCAQHSVVLQQGYYGEVIPERTYHLLKFSNGYMGAASPGNISTESWELLKRATAVFSFAYTRFLDLQKAEAQAREARIELALERVRARTMAMHSSEDVVNATGVLFKELHKLGIENMRCGILIIDEDRTMEVWSVTNTDDGKTVRGSGRFNMDDHPLWRSLFTNWKQKDEFYYYHLAGEDKKNYYRVIAAKAPKYFSAPLQELPDQNFQGYNFPEGTIWTFSLHPHSEEDKKVLKRFTAVFSLTFRRYQDLKRAEEQAREATIEAALEKVRGKAMAMHNSNDLIATASIVFTELRKLGINSFRSGVGLLTKEDRRVKLYSAVSSEEGDSLSVVGWATLDNHPVLSRIYDCWIHNKDYFPLLKGEELKTYYEGLVGNFTVPLAQSEGHEQYGYFLPFSVGMFYGWSEKPYTETEIKILSRFKTIIDLTFRRYIELQRAEANALEAVRSASLDRVRAEIASMRTTADLQKITPLIWNELTTLGVPFVRCGVFIMDEKTQLVQTFLSTPDGKAILAFHLPYDSNPFVDAIDNWRAKKIHTTHWDSEGFSALADSLVKEGQIATREQYLKSVPRDGLHLHYVPFLQGILYVGNTTALSDDNLHLVQSIADAFSTAYARYEDFNKLESAKIQIEKTLTDLKQTQAQLVQSEKMASLGELTAGIAHEIQNPLNFVNNFSEVNKELLEEMKMEIEKGNFDEVKILAKDIIDNEEKINHHGKRADGIVKGMLQHSRSSSGQKEPTDINALADEYLRLAYHGLRAKDKSFNAKFETKFDDGIGKVPVIPQDIGRVVLNLITNAFYAVTERKKSGVANYEPTVTVSTRRVDSPLGAGASVGSVEISVKDNGSGIPQKVLDKIFQPFFTTKPTGQGTGLGLSMSYDIVKAHGGELRVETEERGGAEFIISLPA